jgi:glutamine amidotransferase
MSKVTIIDYGVGNLLSAARALEFCGATVEVTSDPDRICRAERLVLPGVGAFGDCIKELESRLIDDSIKEFVLSGRPLLGICVGMQILFERGTEFGEHSGLGLLPGLVLEIPRLKEDGKLRKIPHIGWSPLVLGAKETQGSGILSATRAGDAVYFVHSFGAVPTHTESTIATVDYQATTICAAVERENISGCQFHPEKSGVVGLRILGRFLRL